MHWQIGSPAQVLAVPLVGRPVEEHGVGDSIIGNSKARKSGGEGI